MLTEEQIYNWEHFKIADKVCQRAKRGLPQDRWMRGDVEMYSMVKAYLEMQDALSDVYEILHKKGLDSMAMGEKREEKGLQK